MQTVFKSKAELPVNGSLAFLLEKRGDELKMTIHLSPDSLD